MRSQTRHDVEALPFRWQTLRKLVPFLLEHRGRVVWALLFLVLAKVATVIAPFLLKFIVDDLDASELSDTLTFPLGLLLAYGLARLSTTLFAEIRDTLFGRVTERAMRRIGLTVFEHLHRLDLGFHLDRNTGGLFRDIERGVSGISFLMRFMVFNILPTLLEIALVLVILLQQYDAGFALITLAAILAYIAWSIVATEWRTRFVREANLADSDSNTRALDSLLNYETVKYFTNEDYEARSYDRELERWEWARRRNRLTLFALNGGQALIISIGMTAMLILAAYNVRQGNMTLGDFVLVNAFMMQIFLPLNFLGFVYREMKGSLANIERMFALLEVKPRITDADHARDWQGGEGHIRFEKVSFAFSKDRPVLSALSLSLSPGERLAIVGPSGAGKSTLVRLLFRFYDPDAGRVLLDGQDLRTLTLQSVRKAIGIVPQDTVLFNASIRDNIRYGQVEASDAEIEEAVRMAGLEGFIASLPEGLETPVGERGLKLSGGEKQRVSIARVLLKRPPILVFDEATSSLDSVSERHITRSIQELSRQHTSLIIAHRLSTVVDADRIAVLDSGRIIEMGRHEELLQQEGAYYHLWQTQQKEEAE